MGTDRYNIKLSIVFEKLNRKYPASSSQSVPNWFEVDPSVAKTSWSALLAPATMNTEVSIGAIVFAQRHRLMAENTRKTVEVSTTIGTKTLGPTNGANLNDLINTPSHPWESQ